jgi:hypothetical protein
MRGDGYRFQAAVGVFFPKDDQLAGNGLIPVIDAVLFDRNAVELCIRDGRGQLTVADS